MKFFLHKPTSNVFAPDLVQVVDGVYLKYLISQFIMGEGFNSSFMNDVIKEIEGYANQGKKVAVSVQSGNSCGNYFYDNFPYIELVVRHHKGAGKPVKGKYPVFWNKGYLEKLESFLAWFSDKLQPVIQHIEYIKVCGINRNTFEFRTGEQDFEKTDDPKIAYTKCAEKYLAAGYTTIKTFETSVKIINLYDYYFPDTIKVPAFIENLNSFPCIDINNKVCIPKARPDIASDLIFACKMRENFGVQATALTEKSGTPEEMIDSELPIYYQLKNTQFNKSVTENIFEGAIINAQNHNGEVIELYEQNIREHKKIIEKY